MADNINARTLGLTSKPLLSNFKPGNLVITTGGGNSLLYTLRTVDKATFLDEVIGELSDLQIALVLQVPEHSSNNPPFIYVTCCGKLGWVIAALITHLQ